VTPEPIAESVRGDRLAKVIARAGLCSRREAEVWIAAGRVAVNGAEVTSPATTVDFEDIVSVDGRALPEAGRTRLWRYHKPAGLVTTHKDPQGRPTVFERLPPDLGRVISVGRLDLTSEGLLLLTNDGALARVLELPATGWTRRYRVRAFGQMTADMIALLARGPAVGDVRYGPIQVTVDRQQGANVWLTVALREGRNREIRRVLEHLGLRVSRLIRVAFGPFQLGNLGEGDVAEVPGKVLKEQIGQRLKR
jgi:23S rRNA pseudouridine2605 synthase